MVDPSVTFESNAIAIGGAALGFLVFTAGQYDNHLWRLICIVASAYLVLPNFQVYTSQPLLVRVAFSLLLNAAIMWVPHLRRKHLRGGCVVITGCDSGMGQATAVYLAKSNNNNSSGKGSYDKIFAACFNAKAAQVRFQELIPDKAQRECLQVIQLDATKDASVALAAKTVGDYLVAQKTFLAGVINYHGVAFNGPVEYMPIPLFETQMQVNFFGNVRMVQAFLPLLKNQANSNDSTNFRRMIFTGTGGGPCTPCPSLLSAYMCSKFAGEAMAQSLKQELYMTQGDGPTIDVSVINPGFVKPTQLMADGIKLSEKMWRQCEDKQGSSIAKDTFGKMMDHFHIYAALQPGTHVSEVCKAAEHALTAHSPRSSYKGSDSCDVILGIDSKLAPIAGMLPTGAREWLARNGIYGFLSPAKTVKGYRV